MKVLKTFVNWMRLRPLLSASIAFAVGINAGICGVKDTPDSVVIPIILGIGLFWAACFWWDRKKLVASLLILSIVVSQAAAQENDQGFAPAAVGPVTIGVGLGLLCGGAYLAVRVVKACEKNAKKFKALTNSPSASFSPGDEGDDYHAGMVCWRPDTCYDPEADLAPAAAGAMNGFTINVVIDDSLGFPEPRILSIQHTPDSELVTAKESDAQLSQWGLSSWTGRPGVQYALNGQPVDQSRVPFTMNAATGDVVLFPQLRQYTLGIEVTTDLPPTQQWRTLFTISMPANKPIEIQDLEPSNHTFYRVHALEP